jgi:hypothetical protein
VKSVVKENREGQDRHGKNGRGCGKVYKDIF